MQRKSTTITNASKIETNLLEQFQNKLNNNSTFEAPQLTNTNFFSTFNCISCSQIDIIYNRKNEVLKQISRP
jgi:hypothetical protein